MGLGVFYYIIFFFIQSPAATFEKHGEHLPRGEGRFGVSRRRHNSSDGFFNNGPLRTAGGKYWIGVQSESSYFGVFYRI